MSNTIESVAKEADIDLYRDLKAPRAYRLPYSPELEHEIARAARAEKTGARVAVTRARPANRDRDDAPQTSGTRLRFVRLPPAEVPAKGVHDGPGYLTPSAVAGQDA